MDRSHLKKEEILKNFGGANSNSLKNILQNVENDREIETVIPSQYYTLGNMPTQTCETQSNLLIISLNTQSILSKFGSIEIMIHKLNERNISPDVLLFQESWR